MSIVSAVLIGYALLVLILMLLTRHGQPRVKYKAIDDTSAIWFMFFSG